MTAGADNVRSPRILMVAGEASADMHAAALLEQLRELVPDLECFGVGGTRLRNLGMEVLIPAEQLNVVGGADWLDRWREILDSYRGLCAEVETRRPDCAVLLDLPDFNLRLAGRLRALGIPVVYYISPQVWAWRKYRIRKIRRNIDRMLVVFPFERDFYERNGVNVEFVGHPLLERLSRRENYRPQSEVIAQPRIALLPGSRRSELKHHAELLNELAASLRARYPLAEIRVPVASTLSAAQVNEAISGSGVEVVEGDSRKTIEWADVALVASGTAALETAIIGTPFTLFYRMSKSTSWIVENVVRYRNFYGMPNLLHKREVVREFVHGRAKASAIFEEAVRLIEDEAYRKRQAADLGHCIELLGEVGASARAASQVRDVIRAGRASAPLSL